VAGILFGVFMITALVLLRVSVPARPEVAGDWLTNSHRRAAVAIALNLIPFAGIAFLWFIGVLRDRIGEREDRLFGTVFLGSGLLFVGMLFVAAAVAGATIATSSPVPPGADLLRLSRNLTGSLLNVYTMRMAAVFTLTTVNIARRTAFVSRWLVVAGLACAVALLVGIGISPWVELLFPAWILALSLDVLIAGSAEPSPAEVRPLVGNRPGGLDGGKPVEDKLHADRRDEESEHLLGHQHAVFVELVADSAREPEHRHVHAEDKHKKAEFDGEDADRLRFGGDGDQADDAHRVEQVRHGQRELRELDRILPAARGAAVRRRFEHHRGREYEEDHAARDRQRSDREVQQTPQQLAQHHQHYGNGRRGGQHLAQHAPLRRAVQGRRDFQERYQSEFRPDADQQHQERVDRAGRGDR
jgi:hypothetical protein